MADNIEQIIKLVEPIVTEESCELVDIEITSELGAKILRVYIDKPNGVEMQDCSRVSHAIEDLLEVEDVVAGRYNLEVSSPGLNRPLRRAEHFQKVLGKMVNVTTKDKLNGRKRYKGVLKDVANGNLYIHIDNQDFEVPLQELAKANLVFEFK